MKAIYKSVYLLNSRNYVFRQFTIVCVLSFQKGNFNWIYKRFYSHNSPESVYSIHTSVGLHISQNYLFTQFTKVCHKQIYLVKELQVILTDNWGSYQTVVHHEPTVHFQFHCETDIKNIVHQFSSYMSSNCHHSQNGQSLHTEAKHLPELGLSIYISSYYQLIVIFHSRQIYSMQV